jgi:predicted alpha/beta-hydrolase family hydrolase
MPEKQLTIDVPGAGAVSALLDEAPGPPGTLVIYAPGAGSNLRDPFGAYLAARLVEAGCSLLRFQFPYTEAGRRLPDRNPVLEATWRAAIEMARERTPRLVGGGRSMGGRIASQVVAQGTEVAGLALFAYPLHPPGRPDQPRDKHLPSISIPTLFVSGTRDAFGSPDDLYAAAAKMPNATVSLLEGADHAFNVAKATGRTRTDVWEEACASLLSFLRGQGLIAAPGTPNVHS